MPRRVIYIKNPRDGSHFRTLGGPGAPRPRSTSSGQSSSGGGSSFSNNPYPFDRYNANGTPILTPPGSWHIVTPGRWDWKTRSYIAPKKKSISDFGTLVTTNTEINWADFRSPFITEQAFKIQTVQMPRGLAIIVSLGALVLGVALAPVSAGSSILIPLSLAGGGAGLAVVSSSRIPMTYRQYNDDLVSIIGNIRVRTETYENKSPVSGKTTKTKLVVTYEP